MSLIVKIIIIISIIVIFVSCGSMDYSPSINLPDKIREGETKVFAGYENLPLTGKNEEGKQYDNGIIMSVQYGFSDKFSIQAKYWADINTMKPDKVYKHGGTVTTFFLINDNNAVFKYYIAPTIGMSMDDNSIDMGTIGAWFAVQTPHLSLLEPYLSFGFLYGNTSIKENYYGFGIMTNIGSNIQIYKNLLLNIEVSVPTLINMVSETTTTYLTPTIGFQYGI